MFLRNLLSGSPTASSSDGATRRAIGNNINAGSSIGRLSPERAVDFYYERVLYVFRCVDSIATKLSALNIVFKQGEGEAAKKVDDYDLDRILNRQANPYETGQAFRYRVYTLALLSTKGVFIEIVRSAAGTISQLHVIPPGRVEPVADPNTYVAGYWVNNPGGGREFLKPEQVLWIKLRPHPTDPYRSLTPLEAAGVTADTDYLARLFNHNFLKNDGRPGMLVTVADLQPDDADILRSKFGGGGSNAGQTTIIEGNGVDVADMSANPRDVQWLEALNLSRDDILAAFGVPSIAFGSSNEKTFDNADAESVSYWTETLVPTGTTIGRGFDVLTLGGIDDDVHVLHDTDSIHSLQATRRARAEDLRAEVAAGLKSINDYNREMGYPISDAPEANVLWFDTTNLTPIGDPSVVKKIRDAMQSQIEQQQPATRIESITQGEPIRNNQPRRVPSALPPARSSDGTNLRQLAAATSQQTSALKELSRQLGQSSYVPRQNALVKRAPRRHKDASSHVFEKKDDEANGVVDARIAYENEIEEALNLSLDNARSAISYRLTSVKTRRGTRHWEGEEKAAPKRILDAAYVVQRERWATMISDALKPRLRMVAEEAAEEMITKYGIDRSKIDLSPVLDVLNNRVVATVLAKNDGLASIIAEAEQRGDDLEKIRDRVDTEGAVRGWVKPFVVMLTTAAIEGAREAVAERVGNLKKTWVATIDERTRDSHRRLNGKTVKVSQSFRVNGATIRRPGDPEAPIGETINCRCSLAFQV